MLTRRTLLRLIGLTPVAAGLPVPEVAPVAARRNQELVAAEFIRAGDLVALVNGRVMPVPGGREHRVAGVYVDGGVVATGRSGGDGFILESPVGRSWSIARD